MLKFCIYLLTLIGTAQSASIVNTSFKLYEKTSQTDTNIHTIINLVSQEKTSECANYCMMQGDQFK